MDADGHMKQVKAAAAQFHLLRSVEGGRSALFSGGGKAKGATKEVHPHPAADPQAAAGGHKIRR